MELLSNPGVGCHNSFHSRKEGNLGGRGLGQGAYILVSGWVAQPPRSRPKLNGCRSPVTSCFVSFFTRAVEVKCILITNVINQHPTPHPVPTCSKIRSGQIFFFNELILSLAVLGLCCTRAFSHCG